MPQNALLKIGEFSQISQVSVKTLRYYDDVGLLRPVHIDPSTSYRYYSVEQIARIHRIMALKEIGLSLEQIKLLLDDDLSTEQIRGMLRLKQTELQSQMREFEKRLAMVEFRLRMIEAEVNFPELDVVIKRLEPMSALSLFVELHHSKKTVSEAVKKAIRDGQILHTGVVIDVFHGDMILPLESPALKPKQHEILFAVEASQETITLDEIGTLTFREISAIETAATLILSDINPEAKFEKVVLLRRWAIAHDYKPVGLVRYLHHRSFWHTDNPADFIFEAQLAVE